MERSTVAPPSLPGRTRRSVRLAVVATAVAAVATTIGISSVGTAAAEQTTPIVAALPDKFTQQKPDWKECPSFEDSDPDPALRCGTIAVPLDYREPAGRTLELAISRIASSAPEKRRGIMLFNPGGPGGTGLDMPSRMRKELPKDIADQYDLIGFDPRGLAASSPVTCDITENRFPLPRRYKPETFAQEVEWARTTADKCAKHGDVLAYINTRNTARDLDLIRMALGEEKLSYFGFSYGTYLGAVYTQLFPERADRMVLDSAVDPALAWRGTLQAWAVGSNPAFERFTAYAAQNDGIYHLGTTAGAVAKTFWDLVAKADVTPINGRTGDNIRFNFRTMSFFQVQAAEELVRLKRLAEGGAPIPSPASRPPGDVVERNRSGPAPDNIGAVLLSIFCNDVTTWPQDPQRYAQDASRDKKLYPLAGDSMSNIMPCAFWSIPRTEPDTTVDNSVGALVVQNEWDSQTPSFSGLGLHAALKGSRMVFVKEGEGHGVYRKDGDPCAYAAVNAYLAAGDLPAQNVTCTATAPATDAKVFDPAHPWNARNTWLPDTL